MGPGWYCDGCGDYRQHNGSESFSVAQQELRERVQRLEGMLRKLVQDYDEPSDETYESTLRHAAEMVGYRTDSAKSGGSDG